MYPVQRRVDDRSETARQLDSDESVLSRWKRRMAHVNEADWHLPAFPGSGNARDVDMARLKRDNARFQAENEILKKAVLTLLGGQIAAGYTMRSSVFANHEGYV